MELVVKEVVDLMIDLSDMWDISLQKSIQVVLYLIMTEKMQN